MPIIKIEFDDKMISTSEITPLCRAIRDIVSDETEIKEVMVYANTALIKVQVDPIEIFIEMSASIMEKHPNLTDAVKSKIITWKNENNFKLPINLTLIPMKWEMAIGL